MRQGDEGCVEREWRLQDTVWESVPVKGFSAGSSDGEGGAGERERGHSDMN